MHSRGWDTPDGVCHEARGPEVTASAMISCMQGERQKQRVSVGLGAWFCSCNCPTLWYPFGSECCGTTPTFRTANITTRPLLWQWIACMSLGVLLSCALWLHPRAAHSGAR